ncbi:hypothetical protein PRZ48_008408 [Zasmidium cellare]|uniref:N-acetyltransferase domain-containing protein n=1 Tax=Zasmidium cellare TaxID=395010 RepID=A0ABR0EFD7_ZASCE|nr:hypothetical protein PRZ48_008408 [Zasmidium cellare]
MPPRPLDPSLRIEPANAIDLPLLAPIFTTAFSWVPWLRMVGYTPTPQGHAIWAQNQVSAWRTQARESDIPMCVKCVHIDPATKEEVVIGMACWIFHPKERPVQEFSRLTPILAADWVRDPKKRTEAREALRAMLERQVRWMGGRAFAELHFLCVDLKWERRGAGTALVRWGVERSGEIMDTVNDGAVEFLGQLFGLQQSIRDKVSRESQATVARFGCIMFEESHSFPEDGFKVLLICLSFVFLASFP